MLCIALLQSRWQFWSYLVFAILLQKAENLFIVPRVMSKKVSISPLAVFIAFMIGASLLGDRRRDHGHPGCRHRAGGVR